MADRVRKINYCYVNVPNRAGRGTEILEVLRDEGVNLLAYSGFPGKARQSQLDLIPENMAELRGVAKANGWRLSKTKKGFLIQGNDRTGAALLHLRKLSDKKINVTAADAVAAGKGRYGMILWVKPKDYARASRALGAK